MDICHIAGGGFESHQGRRGVSLSKTLHLYCLVLVNPGKSSDMTEKLLTTVILFGILGSYLFPYIWEKTFKQIPQIHKIEKRKTIFGLRMTPLLSYKEVKMSK